MKKFLQSLFCWLLGLKLHHADRLAFSGPAVVMPNHVSFLDAILLYCVVPRSVWFVVNSEVAQNPFVAFALRFQSHVIIDPRNPYSLRTIIAVVREGNPVVLFPEGRITTTGNLMKMYTGAAMVAWKTDAKIYPIILRGPEYSKFSRVTNKLKTRWFPRVDIFIAPAQKLSVDATLSFRVQKQTLTDHLLSLMQQASFDARQQAFGELDFFARLLAASRLHGTDKLILRDLTRSVNYRTLIVGIHILAEKIQRILIGKENTVGVLLPNAVAHVTVLFALFKLGKTPAILNFSTGTRNVLDCAQNAGLQTLLTSRVFIEKAGLADLNQQLAQLYRVHYLEDIAATIHLSDKIRGLWQYWIGAQAKTTPQSRLVLFTSGTEGRPKGVVLSHRAILSNIDQVSSMIDYTPADRMLNALPMFHSFGLMAGTMLPILGGVQLYLYPSPLHYRVLPELAYDFNATLMLATPTFLAGYGKMAHPYDFYSMRYILSGGEKLRQSVRELWQDKFGIRLLEGYGVTETGPVLCLSTPLAHQKDSVGRFLPGIEWRLEPVEGIDQGGNLSVRGPNLMDGYLLYEHGFQAVDEWYSTGDVVSVDAAGFVTIQARLKRFAKVAGEMINLQQVEDSALACFGSGMFAAVAVGDGRKGERIILFSTYSKPDKGKLREYLIESGHSGLYLPTDIIQVEKLLLLGSGKPDYISLQKQVVPIDEGTGH
jgi:acyl-[acyl-carrier-protein]-phospholipid O-acyltransferase/long-chain-fatty-acid--[acyl-carrier-protein] ligase